MKKLYGKTWAKLLAAILFCLCATLLVGSLFGVVLTYENEWPYGTSIAELENVLESRMVDHEYQRLSYQPIDLFRDSGGTGYVPDMSEYSTDPAISMVVRHNGKIIMDNRVSSSQATSWMGLSKTIDNYYWQGEIGESAIQTDVELDFYVNYPITTESQWFYSYKAMEWTYAQRTNFVPLSVISFVIAAALFIFLMCAAGRKEGEEGIVLGGLHRVPLDLYATALIFAGVLAAMGAWGLDFITNNYPAYFVLGILSVMGVAILFISLCMTLAARFKVRGWWKNTIIYKLLNLIWRWLKAIWRGLKWVVCSLPLTWRTVLSCLLLFLLNLILFTVTINSYGGGAFFSVLLALILDAGALIIMTKLTLDLRKLFEGGKAIAAGNLSYTVKTEKMRGEFKTHGEALNSISLGVSRAVEERMRSERFKTELITNVSHDLKTPLTSIVSYVDLLKKEDIENESAREYIEVLDRQSKKLRKLTEDLVEASKASSGVISANKEKLDLRELTNQCAGEYGERLSAAGVELISSVPQEEMIVCADGRLLWRVLDNVMQNVVKYAMAGTRAYLGLESAGDKVRLSIKNISREPLNIPAEELMERFVRGDASRSTDGSGLGLSIARSLMEIMGGELRLTLDGDLFKVTLVFEKI